MIVIHKTFLIYVTSVHLWSDSSIPVLYDNDIHCLFEIVLHLSCLMANSCVRTCTAIQFSSLSEITLPVHSLSIFSLQSRWDVILVHSLPLDPLGHTYVTILTAQRLPSWLIVGHFKNHMILYIFLLHTFSNRWHPPSSSHFTLHWRSTCGFKKYVICITVTVLFEF